MEIMPAPEPPQVTIRDALPGEVRRLHQIDRICFPVYMAYSCVELLFYLRHPAAISRVAEQAHTVVGFAIGRIERAVHAHVITLDVIPEARRQGVGTLLMSVLHDEFRKRGAAQAWLEVETGNEAATRFYEGLGYQRRELLRGYYKGRSDAYRMLLLL